MNARESNGSTRRDVLKAVTAGVGGAALGAGISAAVPTLDRTESPWLFFRPDEARLVDALSQQIIPTDQDPGAREAGVVNFIDRQLAGPYERFQQKYRRGLQNLQSMCRQEHGKSFEQLAWDDQTSMLRRLEAGQAPRELWSHPTGREFFGLIRDHSMQGFYGSPRHGGNKDYVSYKMLGLEYPRVIGQNRYRQEG